MQTISYKKLLPVCFPLMEELDKYKKDQGFQIVITIDPKNSCPEEQIITVIHTKGSPSELGQVRANIGKSHILRAGSCKACFRVKLGEEDTKVTIASTLAGPARSGFNSKGREPPREGGRWQS
jgi:hypothetical protein